MVEKPVTVPCRVNEVLPSVGYIVINVLGIPAQFVSSLSFVTEPSEHKTLCALPIAGRVRHMMYINTLKIFFMKITP